MSEIEIGKWYTLDEIKCYPDYIKKYKRKYIILLHFDDGEIRGVDDDFPFAVIDGIIYLPKFRNLKKRKELINDRIK